MLDIDSKPALHISPSQGGAKQFFWLALVSGEGADGSVCRMRAVAAHAAHAAGTSEESDAVLEEEVGLLETLRIHHFTILIQ